MKRKSLMEVVSPEARDFIEAGTPHPQFAQTQPKKAEGEASPALVTEPSNTAIDPAEKETTICPSPVCQCERVTLRCSPELAPQASVPVCLEMDLAQCEIANFKKLTSDPASITVAKAIANEISKADWNKLWGFYLGAKRYLTEHADPDQIDAHFPPEVLAGDGSMVGYYEILPYAKPVEFTLGAIAAVTGASRGIGFEIGKEALLPE
jgi:hypothetical protein